MFRYNFSGLKWQSFPLHQPAIFPIKPSFCGAFSETFLKPSVKNECINKNLTEIPGTGAKKSCLKNHHTTERGGRGGTNGNANQRGWAGSGSQDRVLGEYRVSGHLGMTTSHPHTRMTRTTRQKHPFLPTCHAHFKAF